MAPSSFAAVIVDLSVNKSLDYAIPPSLLSQIKPGVRVKVPLKGKSVKGVVIEVKNSSPFAHVHPIQEVLSEGGLIPPDLMELALWMADYYCSSLHQVFKVLLPGAVRKDNQHKQQLFVIRQKTREEIRHLCEQMRSKEPAQTAVLDVMLEVTKGILLSELLEQTQGSRSPVDTLVKKGILAVDIVRIDRSPLINEEYFQTAPKVLNGEQQAAYTKIVADLQQNHFATHLLHGVTGSGKTEVYLQAIAEALQRGKGVLVLVPEIALTTQMIERFRSRFEGKIAVLHHRLSQGERFDEWHKILRGDATIVIGARSAVFSPLKNLGLIIVDEEHESSYKQSEENPRYHARDVAVMRGKFSASVVVLGSATPSLESFCNAQKGKYVLSALNERAANALMPTMKIIDMKPECDKAKRWTLFSESLLNGIEKRLASGEQALLFLNRRGYHTTLFCQQCRHIVGCPQCDMALTFHKGDNILACHLCNYTLSPPPARCPQCHDEAPMRYRGMGTEHVENTLHAIFPQVRTLRMDADTTKHKGSHQRLLRDFGSGKADVLIGTQMIAKGLHFPMVTLVGILNCDGSLQIPDFRASENVFQLITQVAGRAGRGMSPGEVILQTFLPENRTLELAVKSDWKTFYEEEGSVREAFGYPPFVKLAKVSFAGTHHDETLSYAESFRTSLLSHLSQDLTILPTIPAGYAKVKGEYRFQFLLKGKSLKSLHLALEITKKHHPAPKNLKISVDIDPSSTFF